MSGLQVEVFGLRGTAEGTHKWPFSRLPMWPFLFGMDFRSSSRASLWSSFRSSVLGTEDERDDDGKWHIS